MNAKTTSVAAQLRVLADQLDREPTATWPFGDAQFSPPDEQGFVRARDVELLIAQHGRQITPPPSGIPNDVVPGPVDVPYLFHEDSVDLGDAPQSVKNLVQVSTGSAAFNQNRPVLDLATGQQGDVGGVRMAVPQHRPWAEFFADFAHRHERVRTGRGVDHFFWISDNERQIG